jgi:hypothetical protein
MPQLLERIERTMFDGLRKLTPELVKQTLANTILPLELDALMARRDEIVKLFEEKIAARGEAAILYTMPR